MRFSMNLSFVGKLSILIICILASIRSSVWCTCNIDVLDLYCVIVWLVSYAYMWCSFIPLFLLIVHVCIFIHECVGVFPQLLCPLNYVHITMSMYTRNRESFTHIESLNTKIKYSKTPSRHFFVPSAPYKIYKEKRRSKRRSTVSHFIHVTPELYEIVVILSIV